MKILKSFDDRADKWKLSLQSKIFIALVRSLWHHVGFLDNYAMGISKEGGAHTKNMSERDGYVTMVSKKGNENLEYFSQIIMNYF